MRTWQIVNAHAYGVPQERKRVLIVGYNSTLYKTFVFPKPLSYKPMLQDAIGDLAFIEPSCSSSMTASSFSIPNP